MEHPRPACSAPPAHHRNHPSQSATATAAAGAGDQPQPWTATRCHRLLRPLLAHVAALRKDKERRALVRNGPGSAAPGQVPKPRRTVLGKRSYPYSDEEYSDRKTHRKYSRKTSRRKSSNGQASSATPGRNQHKQLRQPGSQVVQDMVLPTPLLRRVRYHQPSSPDQYSDAPRRDEVAATSSRCSHSSSWCKTKCSFELELGILRPTMDAERFGLHESVFKALDSILRVTSPLKNRAAGPKSLVAMCLRKVPAYIAGLEEWERHESEEKGTKSAVQDAGVSFEVYSQLESLGAVAGWRHLCLVVRAHAVHIVQEALSEGLLEDSVTAILIKVCLDYMPPWECMGLIETFVRRQYPKPRSPDDGFLSSPALLPLKVLGVSRPSGSSLMPGVLADLLADGLLPADWILSQDFVALWPSTVRQITEQSVRQGTVDFVVTTLELLSELASPRRPRGVPQTRLRGKSQTTLVSAVAALGSVVYLSQEGSSLNNEGSSATRSSSFRRRIEHITATCSARLKHRNKGGRKLGTYLLALCSFLSLESDTASAATIEASWRGVQNCRGNYSLMLQYDATTALMSAVAHHCSRGTGRAPHLYLSQFCDKLETLQLPGGALSSMRVDGAFRLAELTGDLRDIAFAEGLRAKAAAAAAGCATPTQGRGREGMGGKKIPSFSGIRWDEGISEWVAATPATDLRPARHDPRLRSHGPVGCGVAVGDEHGREETDADQSTSDAEPNEAAGPASDVDETDSAVSETDDEVHLNPALLSSSSPPPSSSPLSSSSYHLSPSDADIHTSPPTVSDLERQPGTAKPPHPGPGPGKAAKPNGRPSPPVPPPRSVASLLAARPRRLSRPITRAGDELALDHHHGHDIIENDNDNDHSQGATGSAERGSQGNGREDWLRRKKPARFRGVSLAAPTAVCYADGGHGGDDGGRQRQYSMTASTTTTDTCSNTGAGGVGVGPVRKRVARASLVFSRRQRTTATTTKSTERRTRSRRASGSGRRRRGVAVELDGESEDELSVL